MTVVIAHDPDRSRYELRVDDELVGIAAAQLVRYALDDVRRSGRPVVATCWYVADFIDEHPEYRDLVA